MMNKLPENKSTSILGGGYECEFLYEVPAVLQSECAICLFVLREPCLTSCCGNNFCRFCIEAIQRRNGPCPLCNFQVFTVMLNKGLERSLNQLTVLCSNAALGCRWTGALSQLDIHLKETCLYVSMDCPHGCNAHPKRHELHDHEANCKLRPFTCEYCQYSSVYEDVVENHLPQCSACPVQCPRGCEARFPRSLVEMHVENDCLLRLVNCALGCKTLVPMRDMEKHLTENLPGHLSLLVAMNQELIQMNCNLTEKVCKQEATIDMLKAKVESMQPFDPSDHILGMLSHLSMSDTVRKELSLPPFQVSFRCEEMQVVPLSSVEFYSHLGGYKMQIQLSVAKDFNIPKLRNVFLYIHLTKGKFDDKLIWPFSGRVTVSIETVQHVVDFKHVSHDCKSRVLDEGALGKGCGPVKPVYKTMKDKEFCVEIEKVEIN